MRGSFVLLSGPRATTPRFISIPVTAVDPDEKALMTKMKSDDNILLPFLGGNAPMFWWCSGGVM